MAKNLKSLFCFTTLMTAANLVFAAQSHVHGEGKIFVAQEAELWQVYLSFPAADVLGFEHAPKNTEQSTLVKRVAGQLSSAQNIVDMGSSCQLVSVDNGLDSVEHQSHKPNHHEHESEHEHEHEHEHESHHDDHQQSQHLDVEVTYEYECSSPVQEIHFPYLKTLPSLTKMNVEWVTEQGQGASELLTAEPIFAW